MVVGFILLLAAAGLLWAGSELFVEHAAEAGRRLGTSALAVGLLLAGAEPEELVTAVLAALRGRGAIAAGDAIGANVTMLTLVLGMVAVARPFPVVGTVRRYLGGVAMLAVAAAAAVPGGIGRVGGTGLILLYVVAVAVVWARERVVPAIGELAGYRDGRAASAAEAGRRGLVLVVAGITLMAAGGWAAVLGAERLVDAFGVADSVIGLSVVALATTAELFALAGAAFSRGVGELAIAGVVGSAGYNATVTLGGAALARPITTEGVAGAAWLAAGLPLLLLALGGRSGRIRRGSGLVLVGVYLVYLGALFG